MRFSHVTVPTLREKPADAETASHELLIRAGMMRPAAAGIYSFLPLGALALARVENIVRDEMNAAGALEVALPTLHPSEPWIQSGRWQAYGPEMMRMKDRQGREFCLGPTAEEVITSIIARSAPSYRDLPINLYQIQTKFRDEIRPRFGLMRGREFRMKDAYSFHTSEEDLDREFKAMYGAYVSIAKRCSLETSVVEAATGLIGGSESSEFMVPSDIGEDVLVHCESCDYGANAEMEKHRPAIKMGEAAAGSLEEVHTPGMTSIEEVAGFMKTAQTSVIKCVLYVSGNEPVAVFVPGYRDVSESKLAMHLGTDDFHPMREDEIERYPDLAVGFVGPVGLDGVKTVFDSELKGVKGVICGANRSDYHLRGVEEERDFNAEPLFDVASVQEGDLCFKCGGALKLSRGIEIGHIFKLGLKYSEPLNAVFSDKSGELKPIIMGTYGIGTSRMLATVVEQHHDEAGIKWPRAVAPLPVEIIVLGTEDAKQVETALKLQADLKDRGLGVLYDDRDLSPGIKFNDADLVGLPLQVVIGKKLASDGTVDVKTRYTGLKSAFEVESAADMITRALDEAP
ncbi:MAG: proline--tRNA ligase [Actinobacteria bacterium]|nr:proline--tRNA ligase [Actinomycetota bacterium]